MASKALKTVLILLSIVLVLSVIYGCETEKTYTTVIRMNPDGTKEEWKTCSGVNWNGDGSINFIPLKLSHIIRITGDLTVYETVVVVKTETTEEKK